jgi:hypothetical protein
VFGFEKSERDSITREELRHLQDLGASLLGLSHRELGIAITVGAIEEICCES